MPDEDIKRPPPSPHRSLLPISLDIAVPAEYWETGASVPAMGTWQRWERLDSYRDLYDGDWLSIGGEDFEVVDNLFAAIPEFWGNLMLSYPPTLAPEDEMLQSDLGDALYDAVINWHRYGVGLLYPHIRDNEAHIESIDPRLWYPMPGGEGDVVLRFVDGRWIDVGVMPVEGAGGGHSLRDGRRAERRDAAHGDGRGLPVAARLALCDDAGADGDAGDVRRCGRSSAVPCGRAADLRRLGHQHLPRHRVGCDGSLAAALRHQRHPERARLPLADRDGRGRRREPDRRVHRRRPDRDAGRRRRPGQPPPLRNAKARPAHQAARRHRPRICHLGRPGWTSSSISWSAPRPPCSRARPRRRSCSGRL